MKILIASLALVASAPAFSDVRTFEVDSQGCLFSGTHASCVVTNKLPFDTSCELSIQTKSDKGVRIGNTRRVMIPARRFAMIEAFAAEGSSIKSVAASGVCHVIE